MFARDPLAHPEEHIRRVYSYVAYRIGDGPDAEDVTSETFVRALRYRSSYDPKRGAPIAWLIGIARRCIEDARVWGPVSVAEPPETPSLDESADEVINRLMVRDAVAMLDERDRELVALRYGADLTARQIGELLGLRTNAVEVALHRAHARVRAMLEEPLRGKAPDQGEEPVRVETLRQ